MQPGPDLPPPEGTERRDGRLVIVGDSPSFEVMAEVLRCNKKGTAGANKLQPQFLIRAAGEAASVPVVELWEALCGEGGIHMVSLASPWPPLVVAGQCLVSPSHQRLGL